MIMNMIKRVGILMLSMMTLMSFSCTAAAEQKARRMDTAEDADEWISVFLSDHPEELEGVWLMTAQMEAACAQMGGLSGLAKQLSALGTVKETGDAYEGEIRGLKVFYVPCVFSGMSVDLILTLQDGAIAGLTTGPYKGALEEEPASDLYDSIELALPVPELGELPGILTVPEGDGPFPAVILLQGSGPSDKNESVGNQKPFKDIAEGLAKQGIAVYRFDKRTYAYGAEMAMKKDITLMDETIEDGVNAVQLLAEQEKIDPERIFVLGHSLGGNAIPAVAGELGEKPVKAAGYIMMAASPRPLDELMREQYDYLYSLKPEITEEEQAQKDAVFEELDRLQELDSLTEDDQVLGVYSAYWKWLDAYDILDCAQKISEPVLLLQGEEDYQVTMEDFAIWQDALGDMENWQMISYPGLTHTFVSGLKSEGADVYNRAEKVQENVIGDIAAFVKGTQTDAENVES